MTGAEFVEESARLLKDVLAEFGKTLLPTQGFDPGLAERLLQMGGTLHSGVAIQSMPDICPHCAGNPIEETSGGPWCRKCGYLDPDQIQGIRENRSKWVRVVLGPQEDSDAHI